MPNYTSGSTRVTLEQPDLTTFQSNGSVVLDNRRIRPYWFDGRFLDARDLEREQDYFLQREADLGQAEGFQVITGLMVDQTDADGNSVGSGSFVIHAGEGITPAGEMVSCPDDLTVSLASLTDQPTMDVQLGVSIALKPLPQNRNGLYVIGLQPMEHTANPISSYPTTVQGPRTTHDGDIVETTVVSLIPYPNPPASYPAGQQQAALARQIFVTGNPSTLPDSLLPLALVYIQQGTISWIDPYLVRRDVGQQYNGVRFGLSDPSAQEAYLLQYDMQLQSIVASRQINGLRANITASDYLQAIPGCGRFPMDAIDTNSFSQVFFPQEMDVRLSIIPSDELPALLEDGLSLPPIDLTLDPSDYSSISVLALIPVPRSSFEALKNSLPVTPINPILPQVLANRSPLQLLQLYLGATNLTAISPVANNTWASATGNQQYAFYVRRLSNPTMVQFLGPTGVALSSSANPSQFGQTVTLTAGLNPTTATGSVQFLDGTTTLGTSPVTGGIATLSVSNFSVGTHPITATYAGDSADAPGTSSVLSQLVNKATATVTVSSSTNPSILNQSITFTATVTPATATGTVQFLDGQIVLGTETISGGTAAFNSSTLTVGTHAITAAYSGDDNTAAATSAVLTQTVNKIPTSVTLSSSADPSTVGQSVTFTAAIIPATATGTLQFLDGTTALGTGAINGGAAILAVATLTAGAHSITAIYSGDDNNATSTSAVLTQTVNKAATSVAVTSSLNPSTVAQGVTFTATLTPAIATGTVQFLDGTTILGTATLSAGKASLLVSTLTAGTHTITAAYSGDTNDEPSASPALAQTVNKAASGVTISSSANPSTFGQTVTFTTTASPATATGTVQFMDGAASLGSATLSTGTATFSTSALAVGAHSITAAYSGDDNNAVSTSAVLTQTVNKAGTSVTLTSSANPSVVDQSVTFTAKVTPATATGTAQFMDGTTSLGTETVNGGTATLTSAQLALGTHSITAVYSGDADNATATSAVLTQTVNKITTSVALNSSVNPSLPGQAVVFTATMTPATATGTVQFLDGTSSLGTMALSSGVASVTTGQLTVGMHSITAAYTGDANDAGSTSAVLTQTVHQETTQTVLSSSSNPSSFGKAVTFTAAVTPGTATGSAQFLDGSTVIGTGTLSSGKATFTDTALAIGAHSITAIYGGDAANTSSKSAVLTQTVTQKTTAVALTSSVNPSVPSEAVTFTATVTPSTATGSVEFLDGTAVLGKETLASGVSTLTDATLTIGAHSITAAYSGDTNNSASTSPVLTQTVSKTPAAMKLASSANPSAFGQAVTFTAEVSPSTATGNVTFADGTNPLGTVALKAGEAQLTVQQAATGAPGLAAGVHTIIATYAGDADTGSASAQLQQTVNQPVIQ